MLKKRIIGVVNIKDGFAVQSFGFSKYLPLGKPECLVENLDRWGADEILLNIMDLSSKNLGPDLRLLEKIANLGIETPLIYSGGIRSVEDGRQVTQTGADRICVTNLLLDNPLKVLELSELIGLQGVIGAIPAGIDENGTYLFNYIKKSIAYLNDLPFAIDTSLVSELLLIDYKSEGYKHSFNENLISHYKALKVPLILFGGVTEPSQITRIFREKSVSAVCIGNSLNYKENKIQFLKSNSLSSKLREPEYRSEGKINV